MENINKLEATVASWYKAVPHLPASGQKWLAENAWWLVLIGVILSALGIFSVLSVTLLAGALLVGYGGPAGTALGGIVWLAILVSVIIGTVEVIISAIAIAPLKALQKKGWKLLFIVLLIHVASLVVIFLFHYNLLDLVTGMLFAAVSAYFLFEIRDFYGVVHPVKKTEVKKVLVPKVE